LAINIVTVLLENTRICDNARKNAQTLIEV